MENKLYDIELIDCGDIIKWIIWEDAAEYTHKVLVTENIAATMEEAFKKANEFRNLIIKLKDQKKNKRG